MVLLIAERIGQKRNWQGFRDHEDMVMAGVVAGLEALRKFDPVKSSSPFNYLTTVVQHAFVTWRSCETRQDYIEALLTRDELPSTADEYQPTTELIAREQRKHTERLARDRDARKARKTRCAVGTPEL
jgi:DNA-directed RNA polymerase specialized sigma24 family protein